MEFYNFDEAPYSIKHGFYGGLAGDKDGIILNNHNWIVKFPKSTELLNGTFSMPYTTAPLSEYIGSHIYKMLGINVHETLLGKRNGKVVVACKDFCEDGYVLYEMKTIKNGANKELSERLNTELHDSATGDTVNLNELLLHLQYNPLLKKVDGISDHFWDMAIVDIFIENNDRNNGNWGILINQNTGDIQIAPVYDNGNSFENKSDDIKLLQKIKAKDDNLFMGKRTTFEYNNHIFSAKKMLKLNMPELQAAILRVYPKIEKEINQIVDFIKNIPNEVDGYEICSDIRKEAYITGLLIRKEQMLEPVYKKALQKTQQLENDIYDKEDDI